MGLTVSYDLNYRGNLWIQDEARTVTETFIGDVDFCIGNEEDAATVLGVKPRGAEKGFAHIDTQAYNEVAETMARRYGFKQVATSLRESASVLRNTWSGMFYTGGKAYFSRKHDVEIIDRIGGCDSFSAGLIHCLLGGRQPQDAVEFAAAYPALKHTMPTDANWATADEVEQLLNSGGTRIQR